MAGIRPDGQKEREEHALRVLLATRVGDYLASPAASQAPAEVLARMQTRYALRLQRLYERPAIDPATGPGENPLPRFSSSRRR